VIHNPVSVEEAVASRFLQYWGFTQIPFPKTVSAERILPTTHHQHALGRLQQVLLTREIGVVVGETGTGKSTLITGFLPIAMAAGYRVIHLPVAYTKVRELHRAISQALGVNTTLLGADAIKVTDLLSYSYVESRRPNVIVIDEAHILSPACLNELRLLTNTTVHDESVVALVLFGQPLLASAFKAPMLLPLAQRVSAWVTLQGLDEEQTRQYMDWHLETAGQSVELFTPGCVRALARRAGGNPRMINRLAWECLNQACLDESRVVTEEIFSFVCQNLGPHLTE